jgi:hypothetical protein
MATEANRFRKRCPVQRPEAMGVFQGVGNVGTDERYAMSGALYLVVGSGLR